MISDYQIGIHCNNVRHFNWNSFLDNIYLPSYEHDWFSSGCQSYLVSLQETNVTELKWSGMKYSGVTKHFWRGRGLTGYRSRYSEGSLFRRFKYSEGCLFQRSVIQKVCYSEGPWRFVNPKIIIKFVNLNLYLFFLFGGGGGGGGWHYTSLDRNPLPCLQWDVCHNKLYQSYSQSCVYVVV